MYLSKNVPHLDKYIKMQEQTHSYNVAVNHQAYTQGLFFRARNATPPARHIVMHQPSTF